MALLTFNGSALNVAPTPGDIQTTTSLGQLKNVSASSPSTGHSLIFNGTSWVSALVDGVIDNLGDISNPSADELLQFNGTSWVGSSILSPTLININSALFSSANNADADHDMEFRTATKKVLSGDAADRYFMLEHTGLTDLPVADLYGGQWDGYGAQNLYKFKYTTTTTNDTEYNLGDIRFQFNRGSSGGSGPDKTDMSIRIYEDGISGSVQSPIKLLRIKYGSILTMGPDGITGGGHVPSMGELQWKVDRYDLLNHAGRIRLDTTAGEVRLRTDSGAAELRSKSGTVTVRADSGNVDVKSNIGDVSAIAASGNLNLYASGLCQLTGSKIQMNAPTKLFKVTTAERDALTAEPAFMIYNDTTNKAQCYDGTTWQDLW